MLIIQKEFSGFDDTKERLDLLAIDKNGNLVIIENKLDDSGRDVVWQALKYASYCSGLNKSEIKDIFQKYLYDQGLTTLAEEEIAEFMRYEEFEEVELKNDDQRIILIAANFRKEVTSTVLWLLEHNVKIKCIKVTPYELNNATIIDTEQIIPIIEAEEYLIKLANKKQEKIQSVEKTQERQMKLKKFWTQLLDYTSGNTDLFENTNPSDKAWIIYRRSHGGLSFGMVVSRDHARVELYIDKGSKDWNKTTFDAIHKHKDAIESDFGNQLDWQRLDDKRACRISYRLKGVSVDNEEDWQQMTGFLTTNMIKFENSVTNVLDRVV